jgi:hypothetical protein
MQRARAKCAVDVGWPLPMNVVVGNSSRLLFFWRLQATIMLEQLLPSGRLW